MRKRLYSIIEIASEHDKLSHVYDIFMMVTILLSLVPLAFKETNTAFYLIDKITVSVFILDYVLHWLVADYKTGKGKLSFLIYPITPLAIIDIVSILPSLSVINDAFKLLRIFRLVRSFKIFKALRFFRYSKSLNIIVNIFKKQKKPLLTVCGLAISYVLISALVIFNVEPSSFNTFFDAIYWATVSLTTVGYGDIYPVTTVGRIVTMISSIFGIAIIAMPAGIITAGFMEELRHNKENSSQTSTENKEEPSEKTTYNNTENNNKSDNSENIYNQ